MIPEFAIIPLLVLLFLAEAAQTYYWKGKYNETQEENHELRNMLSEIEKLEFQETEE